MARSRQKTQIIGWCGVGRGVNKLYRRQCHKAARADTRTKLHVVVTNYSLICDKSPKRVPRYEQEVIDCKWFYDAWCSPNDGKQWLDNDIKKEWMRK